MGIEKSPFISSLIDLLFRIIKTFCREDLIFAKSKK